MKLKRVFLVLLMFTVIAGGVLFAQEESAGTTVNNDPSAPDPAKINVQTAQQKLKEISVSKFEDSGFWYGQMPGDFGIISLRTFEGGSKDKLFLKDEVDNGIVFVDEQQVETNSDGEEVYVSGDAKKGDVNALGVKVSFYKRGVIDYQVTPIRPLPIPGRTKVLSVWVAGRESKHKLEFIVSDTYGKMAYIDAGKLDFPGWRKMTVSIPSGLRQRDTRFSYLGGIMFEGFRIKCDIDETWGSFFIYFDDLRAVTDLFEEGVLDEDDMIDSW